MRRRAGLVALAAASAVTATVLWRVGGDGPLALPGGSWGEAERWYEEIGPAHAVMALVRWLALGAAAWLTVASTLQMLASVPRGRRLAPIADRASPAVVRRIARGAVGVSLAVGLAAPVPASAAGEPPEGTATMRPLAPGATVPPPTEVPVGTAPPPPTVPADPVDDAPVDDGSVDGAYVVEPGDHLWAIAAAEVGDQLGPQPEAVVAAYWQRLIDANRSHLVDPSNPDLIYPGQMLVVPPV